MLRKRIKKLLTTAVLAGSTVMLASCGSSSEEAFTVWITNDDSGEYYTDYNENPVMQYISENMEFNDRNIRFQFSVAPVASKASENLSTMLATGDVSDIMDVSMAQESVADMYEDGIALDLTDYIDKYMPHYKEWLEAHPEEERQIASYIDVDGDGALDKRYIALYSVADAPENSFSGWLYRRDWIVKYGKNPQTGEAFTGGYQEDGSWTDDVVFPSWYSELGQDFKTAYADSYAADWDGSDPVFLSDWEWMFDIFNTALEDLGIGLNSVKKDGGYAFSMYYEGFYPTGDLVSAFGGTENGGMLLKDGDVYCSAVSDNFREYMGAMRSWYEKGYIDSYFQTRTNSSLFWEVDNTNVYSGKVGMWMGLTSAAGSTINSDDHAGTKGAYVMGARNPINDLYSEYSTEAMYSPDNRFVPQAFYQSGLMGSKYIITSKAAEKDLETLFTFLDWAYDPEKSDIFSLGLSDEQIAVAREAGYGEGVYEKNEITSMGGYNQDGGFEFTEKLSRDDNLKGALLCKRIPHLMINGKVEVTGEPAYVSAVSESMVYTNLSYGKVDYLGNYVEDPEERKKLNDIATDINTFIKGQSYKFLTGEYSVADNWEDFKNQIWKTKNFQYYIEYYSSLYKEFAGE